MIVATETSSATVAAIIVTVAVVVSEAEAMADVAGVP